MAKRANPPKNADNKPTVDERAGTYIGRIPPERAPARVGGPHPAQTRGITQAFLSTLLLPPPGSVPSRDGY